MNLLQRIRGRYRRFKRRPPKIRPTDVFLVSFPRSGNTWVRFLLANLIYPEGTIPVNFTTIDNLIPDYQLYEHFKTIRRLSAPRILKTHAPFDPQYPKVIYLLRDGRDAMVSYYHYFTNRGSFEGTFMDFLSWERIKPALWHAHVNGWTSLQGQDNFLLVRYEDLLNNPAGELARMAAFLQIPFTEASLATAVERAAFRSMQKLEDKKGHEFSSQGRFVRKGQSGGWQESFTPQELEIFYSSAAQTLRKFGYLQ